MVSSKDDKNITGGKKLSGKVEGLRSLYREQETNEPRDNGKRLAVIQRGDDEQLRVVYTSYESHPYVNISLWRKDDGGVYRPVGEKTMSVRLHELADFAEAIEQAVELATEELAHRNGEK